MFGIKGSSKRRSQDEAEKPFWISFSDLMTALMVLFLIAMAVALLAVTQGLAQVEAEKMNRQNTIAFCIKNIQQVASRREFKGVVISGHSIKFGTLAEFRLGRNDLRPKQADFLRDFVPKVLDVARQKSCDQWLKRVVVEGFASQEGSYLYNLNLSFQRSQRILCVLLDTRGNNALSQENRRFVRTLFMASGSSFNAVKKSADESRRVDMTLEFRELDSNRDVLPNIPWDDDDHCPSDYI